MRAVKRLKPALSNVLADGGMCTGRRIAALHITQIEVPSFITQNPR